MSVDVSANELDKFLESLEVNSHNTCSYFPEKDSSLAVFCHKQPLSPPFIDQILEHGFRRSGFCFYKTACENCSACMGYRLPLRNFHLSNSQKKVLRKNKNIQLKIVQPNATKQKEELYIKYQYQQHFQKSTDGLNQKEFNRQEMLDVMYHQMYENTFHSIEMELYREEQLVGFAVFDIGNRSISAVYSVYDPDFYKISPGKLMILRSIQWAKQMDYHYYYLGIYIEGHPKMEYKASYGMAEILSPNETQWMKK